MKPPMAHKPSPLSEVVEWVSFIAVLFLIIVALCAMPPESYR